MANTEKLRLGWSGQRELGFLQFTDNKPAVAELVQFLRSKSEQRQFIRRRLVILQRCWILIAADEE